MSDQKPITARRQELEGLAVGIELTLASVLQGIPLALLIPRIVDLIVLGDIARLLYVPASLLIVFLVWVAFIMYALSFSTWPFNPTHNLIYFGIVCAEAVLLALIDRPGTWFGSLCAFGIAMLINYSYNQRQLLRQQPLFGGAAAQALYDDISAEQQIGVQFCWGYLAVGIAGALSVPLLEQSGIAQPIVWSIASLIALVVPLLHTIWMMRMVPRRSQLIEQR
ncbi:MAG: hypothetical protein Fur005_39930 [Roseiflexaceae bacterium]